MMLIAPQMASMTKSVGHNRRSLFIKKTVYVYTIYRNGAVHVSMNVDKCDNLARISSENDLD